MSNETEAEVTKPNRIDWASMPTEFFQAFRCPRCGGTSFRYKRSEPNGDGTNTRKTVCRDCGYIFKLVVE